jgi:hypothetical protein
LLPAQRVFCLVEDAHRVVTSPGVDQLPFYSRL